MDEATQKNGKETGNHHAGTDTGRHHSGMVQSSAERAETMSEKIPAPLYDLNTDYERSSAEERQKRDALVAGWRDWLHYGLQSVNNEEFIKYVHAVIDSMDTFLNHAGGRRK